MHTKLHPSYDVIFSPFGKELERWFCGSQQLLSPAECGLRFGSLNLHGFSTVPVTKALTTEDIGVHMGLVWASRHTHRYKNNNVLSSGWKVALVV